MGLGVADRLRRRRDRHVHGAATLRGVQPESPHRDASSRAAAPAHPRPPHRLSRSCPDRPADEPCIERSQPGPGVRGDDPAHLVELRPDRCRGGDPVQDRSDAGSVRVGAAAAHQFHRPSILEPYPPGCARGPARTGSARFGGRGDRVGRACDQGLRRRAGAGRQARDGGRRHPTGFARRRTHQGDLSAIHRPAPGRRVDRGAGDRWPPRPERRADDRRAGGLQLLRAAAGLADANDRHDGGVRATGGRRPRTDRSRAQHHSHRSSTRWHRSHLALTSVRTGSARAVRFGSTT